MFVATLVLLLLEVDRQNYQVRKKEIIVNYWDEFFSLDQEDLNRYALYVLEARTQEERDKAGALLGKIFRGILDGDNSIYRIAIEDSAYQILIEEKKDKFREYNTFANSLFLKDFRGQTSLKISDPRDKAPLGRLIIGYTTPRGDERITTLTRQYRIHSLSIAIVLCLVYAYILKYLILPVKRVVARLDEARDRPPLLFSRPRSLLEKQYNNLSRDALITRVSQKLKDFLGSSTNLEYSQILEQLPPFISSLFHFHQTALVHLKRRTESEFEIAESYKTIVSGSAALMDKAFAAVLAASASPAIPMIEKNLRDRTHLLVDDSSRIFFYTNIVDADTDMNDILILVLFPDTTRSGPADSWFFETWRLLASEIRDGLQAIENQRKVIFREKSEATISLSRNLGHDLTNIIATSKLDLLAVKSFLDMDENEMAGSPMKQRIFKESLAALLKNTMFLQQIVNVYRSFSFIKRPRFEFVDVNHLLTDVVDLFRLSTSASIDIRTSFAAEMPHCRLEQRLVKLAIFNLLTNALDAIRRKYDSGSGVTGFIVVKTIFDAAEDQVVVSIRDSGDGIRNEQGHLATPVEMDRIFSLGYSTKKHEEGEGLGLNWVYTIIAEFHKGRILPTNHPDGGAEFLIFLKRDFPEGENGAGA